MARHKNLLDVAAQFTSSIVGRGCYLGLQVFLARRLGPLGFGLYAIAWTVVGLVGTLAPIGMPQAVIRFGVGGRRALWSAPLFMAIALGVVCSILVWVTSGYVSVHVFGNADAASVITAFAPSVLLLGVFQVLTAAMRASQATVASAIVSAAMFATFLSACVVAFLVYDTPSAVTAGWMYALALAAASLVAAWYLYQRPPTFPVLRISTLTRFGVITMLIHSASVLNLWADRVIVGVMSDAEAVGIYQVASQLAMVALVLRVAVISVFEVGVPKAGDGDAVPDITKTFVSSTRILLHVTAPGLICLATTAAFWTGTLFGKAYMAAALPLGILAGGQLIQSFTGPSVTAVHMTGGERYAAGLTIITGLVNIIVNIVLIPVFGLAGSAAASSLANVILGVEGVLRLYLTDRLTLRFGDLADIVIAVLICSCMSFAWRTYLGTDHLGSVVALLALNYFGYAVVVARLCRVDDEILQLLSDVSYRFFGVHLQPRFRSN